MVSVLLWWQASFAHAEVTVNAALDSSQVDVGESTTLQVTVTGADDAEDPKLPSVPHLQIQAVGRQTSYNASLGFGSGNSITQQLIFSYSLTADQAGNYTIPAITVTADGKSYSSNPVSLVVGGSTSQNTGQSSGKNYFAQIVVPKTSAYVGESLPVEIKYYVDGNIPLQAGQEGPPSLDTNGLTAPKLRLSDQGQTDYQGRPFRVIVFKTIATPVKAGTLQVGPSSFIFIMQLPDSNNRRRRSPFGNSPFQQFFGDDDVYNLIPRQVTVTADATPLQVKPLPVTGRPADFSGAVGNFKIVGQSSASEVKAGEPLTVTVSISGRGNFDRIASPQLEQAPGWRSYPATSTMKADDDIGLSGTKTFQISLVPSGGQTEVPPLHFSYFDPEQEKYISLSTDKIPVKVDGSIATPTPAPIVAAATATPAANNAAAADRDILYILPSAQWDHSAFTPIYRTAGFWVAQAIPLSALLGFALLQHSRRRAGDERSLRLRTLTKQSEEQKTRWQRSGVARGQFYEAATAWMRTVSAIHHGGEPGALSGNEILARSGVDAATREELKSLFDLHGEMLYAGGARSEEPLPENRRTTLVSALNSFEKQP